MDSCGYLFQTHVTGCASPPKSSQRWPLGGGEACHDCFARMLRPIVADGDFKKLECPECRVVMNVLRGRADSLPKVFGMLR